MAYSPDSLSIDDTQEFPRVRLDDGRTMYEEEAQTTTLPPVPPHEQIVTPPNEYPQFVEPEPSKAIVGIYTDPQTQEVFHAVLQDGVMYKGSRFDASDSDQNDYMVTYGRVGKRQHSHVWADDENDYDRLQLEASMRVAQKHGVQLLVAPMGGSGIAPAIAPPPASEGSGGQQVAPSQQTLQTQHGNAGTPTAEQQTTAAPKTSEQRLKQKQRLISAGILALCLVTADGMYNNLSGHHDTMHPITTVKNMVSDFEEMHNLVSKL